MGAKSSIVIIVVAAVALAGCATPAQRKAVTIRNGTEGAAQQMKVCVTAARSMQGADAVATKYAEDSSQPSLQQLTDSNLPNDGEVKALFMVHDAVQQCRANFVTALSSVAPTLANVFVESYQKSDSQLVLLVQKKQTWGEYNKAVQQIAVEARGELTKAGQQIDASLQRENAQEVAQQQRAVQNYLSYMQNQQAIAAANRPINTQCYRIGNVTNCTTN
jgi:leucyl-tRNA synthetase